ncbi:MAG: molybdopterin converting factor subunit 1 [Rhodospirillaceae bacterium]|nr:molybdopterin converting factor subunit 1 [Rhodospirillaceae bacterium]
MSLTVLYFAWVKDKIGRGEETLSLPASITTVSGLMDWLATLSPGHAAAFSDRRMIKAAVDQQHVDHGTALNGAREVAFFPPVTGG